MTTWTIKPGIAALVDLTSSDGKWDVSVIFLSHEKGAVFGSRDHSIKGSSIPLQVQASINRHFGTVFALEHETWKGRGPSPRTQYCDALEPWTVEVPDDLS